MNVFLMTFCYEFFVINVFVMSKTYMSTHGGDEIARDSDEGVKDCDCERRNAGNAGTGYHVDGRDAELNGSPIPARMNHGVVAQALK